MHKDIHSFTSLMKINKIRVLVKSTVHPPKQHQQKYLKNQNNVPPHDLLGDPLLRMLSNSFSYSSVVFFR